MTSNHKPNFLLFSYQTRQFSSLIYIIIQPFTPMCLNGVCRENLCTPAGGCMGMLEKQLLVIFLSRVIVSNLMEMKGVLRKMLCACREGAKAESALSHDVSPAEEQFFLKEYVGQPSFVNNHHHLFYMVY